MKTKNFLKNQKKFQKFFIFQKKLCRICVVSDFAYCPFFISRKKNIIIEKIFLKSGPEIKDLVRKMSAPIKFYRAWTPQMAQKAGLHYIGRNAPDARARKFFLKRWARAHSEKYLLTFAKRAGGPPAPWGGGPCARARARALSTRDFQNSHFLLYNFQKQSR